MNPSIYAWAVKHHVSLDAIAELKAMWGDGEGPATPNRTTVTTEAGVQTRLLLEAAEKGKKLWRNNVGALLDKEGRQVRFGLGNDSKARNAVIKSGDLIGIDPVLITLAHVGRTIGQFVSYECKRPDWTYSGTPREVAQLAWIQLVLSYGGRAMFVNAPGVL